MRTWFMAIVLYAWLVLVLGWCLVAQAQPACAVTKTLKTSAVLAWQPPTALDPAVTLTGYSLEQQIDTGTWVQVATTSASVLTTTVNGLQPGHSYFYRVRDTGTLADGSSGQSGPNTTQGTPNPCVQILVITEPGNLTATPK